MKGILTITFACLSIALFGQTKEDSIRWQKLAEQRIAAGRDSVYQQLLRTRQPENYMDPSRLSYSSHSYFTEASKQLLLEILQDDWLTNKQKQELARKEVWKQVNMTISSLEQVLEDKRFKKRKAHFQVISDSLKNLKILNVDTVDSFQAAMQRYIQSINERKILDLYIYTAGMLEDQRYISVLQEALNDSIHYNPYAAKMALARNGIEPHANEILKQNQVDLEKLKNKSLFDLLDDESMTFQILSYLCTQEAIKEYAKLLQLEHFDCIDGGDYQICSVPSSVIIGLYNIINNTDFKSFFKGISPYTVTHQDIKWAQDWLEKNYGNYELDRNFYPGLR